MIDTVEIARTAAPYASGPPSLRSRPGSGALGPAGARRVATTARVPDLGQPWRAGRVEVLTVREPVVLIAVTPRTGTRHERREAVS